MAPGGWARQVLGEPAGGLVGPVLSVPLLWGPCSLTPQRGVFV